MKYDIENHTELIDALKDTLKRTFLSNFAASSEIGVEHHTLQRILDGKSTIIRRPTVKKIKDFIEKYKEVDYTFSQKDFVEVCDSLGESYNDLEKRSGISASTIRTICCNEHGALRQSNAIKVKAFIQEQKADILF